MNSSEERPAEGLLRRLRDLIRQPASEPIKFDQPIEHPNTVSADNRRAIEQLDRRVASLEGQWRHPAIAVVTAVVILVLQYLNVTPV